MGKIDKIYVRDTRNQLGRYPNWPIIQQISLGKIGYYFSRKAVFVWETDLNKLGITAVYPFSQQRMSELYTSENSVSIAFSIDSSTGNSKAIFDFSKKRSVATQGHDVGYQVLDIDNLNIQLLNKINNGLKWDYDWVIITEIWTASGFTTLISNSSGSHSEISANTKISGSAFNVADFNLGLKVTGSKKMGYQGVAEKNVQPYFQIHRLTRDNKLKRYGI
ncbi:MAG TPA: hypothetical protein VJY62_11155 [Bacteroidia bacterium]|nr:hypothetical protein [Bacteroidia bacterium]